MFLKTFFSWFLKQLNVIFLLVVMAIAFPISYKVFEITKAFNKPETYLKDLTSKSISAPLIKDTSGNLPGQTANNGNLSVQAWVFPW